LEGEARGRSSEHKCLNIIEYQTKVRPDLGEAPFQTRLHFLVGRTSWVIRGKRHNG
jgi:hypothetical protein